MVKILDLVFEHGRCWQVLGLDILLTQKFEPFLLEVNAGPSLSIEKIIEVPTDYKPVNKYEKVTYILSLCLHLSVRWILTIKDEYIEIF